MKQLYLIANCNDQFDHHWNRITSDLLFIARKMHEEVTRLKENPESERCIHVYTFPELKEINGYDLEMIEQEE